jgi:ATP-dependent Zn protease
MTHAQEHCDRPWWKRPPVWFGAIAVVALLSVVVIEQPGKPTQTPYSTFLDQLEAGNVASVSLQGTQIEGHYKHALSAAPSSGTSQRDVFSSRVPDFGDPALILELRKQHVVIDASSPSPWAALLAHLPWPMLLLVGALAIAGVARLLRGGKVQSGSAVSTLPAHGIVGLVAGLFTKRNQTANPSPHDSDEPKSH